MSGTFPQTGDSLCSAGGRMRCVPEDAWLHQGQRSRRMFELVVQDDPRYRRPLLLTTSELISIPRLTVTMSGLVGLRLTRRFGYGFGVRAWRHP